MNSKGPSIKPFAQLFRVADLAHEALIKDTPMTKRDMYYMDVPLFKSQSVVDRLVDDLAATIDVGRAELNIRASSKGLLCGSSLCIHLLDGQAIHATDSEPILIPVAEDIERFELKREIQWVLIVEKDAVFQTLCRAQLTRIASLPGPGIMITGKGYPDLATRQLVRTLSDNLPESIPILALVDGDAFGIDIASVYKFGSHALRHEKEKLVAERVECIGVWASELQDFGIDRDAMLPITKADEKKARTMLRRSNDMMPLRWKQELARMLHTRRKAETEILSTIKSSAFDEPSEFPAFASSEPTSVIGHPLVRYLTAKITQRLELLSASLLAPDSPVSTDSDEDLLFP
ncbi:topoisomerase acting in meiosis [Dentipellis sp. KUC8613]|nr:topoisomerase acting in meiosis [Dentipellis sp. KUC8613]